MGWNFILTAASSFSWQRNTTAGTRTCTAHTHTRTLSIRSLPNYMQRKWRGRYGAENTSKPERNMKTDARKSDQSNRPGKQMLLMTVFPMAVAERYAFDRKPDLWKARQQMAPSSRAGEFSWLSGREHAPEAPAKCLTSEKYSVLLYPIKYFYCYDSSTTQVF